MTSPRGLRALLRNAGSGAAPPPPAAGETRANPGRAPRAPRRLCSQPEPGGRPPLTGSWRAMGPAPLAALLQKLQFEKRELGKQCGRAPGGDRRDTSVAHAEASRGSVPKTEVPAERWPARRTSVEAPRGNTHLHRKPCSLLMS